MTPKAREALRIIRRCVARGQYSVARHFTRRMDERGMVWADVLALLDVQASVRSDGKDEYGCPKWIIAGKATDGVAVEMVCVLDADEQGRYTAFVTIYWPMHRSR